MKVFFTASMRGKKLFENNYKLIYEAINSLGYQLIDKLLLENTIEDFYKKLESGGRKVYVDFYNDTISKIKEADINVFECSLPSLGIGFQVDKSLELNKPTVVLYYEKNIPHFIAGTSNEKLILISYTKETLLKVLKQALEEAKMAADKRFNFFISPQLLNYLESVSKQQGVTKSSVIRSLLLDHMKKNR